ncbi:MAG TPA: hypothetical protein VHZ73_02360, partial [Vicinamibacterales bacterium]|nr:hypothetical protein [Vicinamibacterales bacterium]
MTRRNWITSLLALHLLVGIVELALSGMPIGDFKRFWAEATTEGRPYVDYLVEVPLGALGVFKLFALPGSYRVFAAAIVILNIACDLLIARCLWRVWGARATIFYLACALPVLPLVNYRMDLWSTLMATCALAAWTRQRPAISGAAAVVGASLKIWPLPLAVWFVADPAADWRSRRRAIVALAVAGAIAGAIWLAVAGVGGPGQVVTFRAAQGWEIESTVGSVLNLLDPGAARIESGAWRTGHMSPTLSVVLLGIATVLMSVIVMAGARKQTLGATWIAGVGVLLICSPLFSAQYIVWLAPAAAIAWSEGDERTASMTAATIFLTGLSFVF